MVIYKQQYGDIVAILLFIALLIIFFLVIQWLLFVKNCFNIQMWKFLNYIPLY